MDHPEPARSVFLLGLLAATAAYAQVYPGGYPGGYPYPYPGGYPGGSPVPGIPIPHKGKPQADSTKGQPLPNFRGKLKRMDDKTITLAMTDDRDLDFKRTSKTKFFKDGKELKDPKFGQGDQISIEGPEDEHGYMTAVNVYWERSAEAAKGDSAKNDDGAVDTWKDAPKDAPKDANASAASAASQPATEIERPAKPDPDDPGPPSLHRGKPTDQAREHAPEYQDAPVPQQPNQQGQPQQIASNSAPVNLPRMGDDTIPANEMHVDDLIRKATAAALDFTETLPNYVCTEQMARYQSDSNPPSWQAIDIVSANVVYENGKEDYRNLAINGKAINKKMDQLDGAWSTGEFGTVLIDLFNPATAADFHPKGSSRTAGITAKLYDFDVAHDHSHWDIHVAGQSYTPAYRGSVWIDPQTARVLRIEMQAYGFPSAFPTDHVEMATDYEYVRLGDTKQYLLPVHSENLSCQRGSNECSRNAIDFRNYHKYSGESTIKFGDSKQ
jgi:hypothetical protein